MTCPPVRRLLMSHPRCWTTQFSTDARGGVHDDRRQDAQPIAVHPVGRGGDAEGGDDTADPEDGRGDAADAGVVLTVVHRVAGHADLGQFLLKGLGAGHGAGREGLEVEVLDERLPWYRGGGWR